MTRTDPTEGWRALARPWGKPDGWLGRWQWSGRDRARALIVIGVVVATWGFMTAVMKIPEPGVDFEAPPGLVRSVLPGGPAWHSGIRADQAVVAVTTGESELDWVLHSRGAGVDYYLTMRGATAELRGMVPVAVGALIVALIAATAAFRRPREAAAAASLAGSIGAIPLMFDGHPVVSSVGGLLMFSQTVTWLVAIGPRQGACRVVVAAVAFLVAIGWLTARFAVPGAYDTMETGRIVASVAAALATLGLSIDRRTLHAAVGSIDTLTAVDLLGLALTGGLLLSLWLVVGVSPVVLSAVLAVVAIVYVRSRRPVARALERLLLGERLERASVKAVEAERGRLAREIHDEPLQELSGVIKRIETDPTLASEATALRGVATHLRAVATELQPPVLYDLGLGPAIAFLAQQANSNGASVRVEAAVVDRTTIASAARLPPEVELVLFRICQETITNAQHHSGGTIVTVTGELTPDRAELRVRDDGAGLSEQRVLAAQRQGRLGFASMRQRAATIGAVLEIAAAPPHGTVVSVRWRRP